MVQRAFCPPARHHPSEIEHCSSRCGDRYRASNRPVGCGEHQRSVHPPVGTALTLAAGLGHLGPRTTEPGPAREARDCPVGCNRICTAKPDGNKQGLIGRVRCTTKAVNPTPRSIAPATPDEHVESPSLDPKGPSLVDSEQAVMSSGGVGKRLEALVHASSTPKGYDRKTPHPEVVAVIQYISP